MTDQIELQAYLDTLPDIITARLPRGTVFTANGKLYSVIASGTGGFKKARQWRCGEETDVALIPNSYLANFLPLVDRGKLLPIYPSRVDLLDQDDYTNYLFMDEQLALDAAYLDCALIQSGDAYVRNHSREPAFAITDGVHVFRLFYYDRSVSGRSVSQSFAAKTIQFMPYSRGPMHWHLLPGWPRTTHWAGDTVHHVPR